MKTDRLFLINRRITQFVSAINKRNQLVIFIAILSVLFQAQADAGFNLGDLNDKLESIVNPKPIENVQNVVETVLAKPIATFPSGELGIPEVINPNNIPFDISKLKLPEFYHPDLTQVILLDDFQQYWTLLPEVLEQAIPLVYDKTYKFKNFLNLKEFWFAFYTNGAFYIDIEIKSEIALTYDVLNQEGASMPLNEVGGLDPGGAPSFYYIRVTNPLASNSGGLFPFPKKSFFNTGFSIKITARGSEGGIVEGHVHSVCDEQPVARASVAIDTDFRYTHTDGSFQFISKTAAKQVVNVLAKGYQSNKASIEVFNVAVTQVDFELTPTQGCETSTAEVDPNQTARQLQAKPVYDDAQGLVYFPDVKAVGFAEGEKHFTAQLTQIADQNPAKFQVSALTEINTSNQNVTALYNAEQATLVIPEVLAYEKRFEVELQHDANYLFSITKVKALE